MIVVYVSGLDGCGKTTQSHMLVDRLLNSGISAEYRWLRWEPSLRLFIRAIRRFVSPGTTHSSSDAKKRVQGENLEHSKWHQFKRTLLGSSLFRSMWLYYAAHDYRRAYAAASQSWKSEVVVLDRYLYDFLIDQSLNFDTTPDRIWAEKLHSALATVRTPDLAVVIDVSPEVGYERKRDGTSLEYLRHREQLYRTFSGAAHVLHVNGEQTPEAIHEQIFSWVSKQCPTPK